MIIYPGLIALPKWRRRAVMAVIWPLVLFECVFNSIAFFGKAFYHTWNKERFVGQ